MHNSRSLLMSLHMLNILGYMLNSSNLQNMLMGDSPQHIYHRIRDSPLSNHRKKLVNQSMMHTGLDKQDIIFQQ